MKWEVKQNETINITLHVHNEEFDGGFIGIGWGSELMLEAEIWLCTATNDIVPRPSCEKDEDTESDQEELDFFTCCVAEAKTRTVPNCKNAYPLEIVESCISLDEAFVTVRAPLCNELGTDNCFNLTGGDRNFIAAFHPNKIGAHGFSRRTSGVVDLRSGEGGGSGSDASNGGLFVLHGGIMLFCWFILIPVAIWIVRYRKEKSWRLAAHLGLVGVTGSMVASIALAAFVSVEGVSFGTVGGGAAFSGHKIVGLTVVLLDMFMAVTGEVRFTRESTFIVKSPKIDRFIFLLHRIGGIFLLSFAWFK